MINIVVVAGTQTDDLSAHLELNCAFKVIFKANSFMGAKGTIQNSIIKADKLLYVYQKDQMNIRADMSFLRDLFLEDSFFDVKEVLFVQKEDTDSEQAEKYFLNIMQDVQQNYAAKKSGRTQIEYSYKTIEGVLTFQGISEILLGVTQASNVKNTISNFYRYEKGNSAKEVYLPNKKQGAFIEPFTFDSLINHNRERQNMSALQGSVLQSESEAQWRQFDSIQLDGIDVVNTELPKNISIITGGIKTGKSTLATFLAASLSKTDDKTLILDFTENQDCFLFLRDCMKEVHCCDMKNFLLSNEAHEESIEVAGFMDVSLYEIRLDVLTLIVQKQLGMYENILLITEYSDLQDVFQIVYTLLHRLIFCVFALKSDINKYKEQLIMYSGDTSVYVVMSDRLILNGNTNYLEAEDVKAMIGDCVKIVKPLHLENIADSEGLHLAILGGDNYAE